jgi:hypothetical protein
MPLENICPEWQVISAWAGQNVLGKLDLAQNDRSPEGTSHHDATRRREHRMWDVIMIAIALGFFALSVGYTIACDQL